MTSKHASPPLPVRCRVNWIQIQGKPILALDFNQATPNDSLAMLQDIVQAFEGQDLNSVRALADLRDVSYDPSISQKFKTALLKLNPYMRATAVFGASGLAVVATMAAIELMHWFKMPNATRKIRLFKTREKALVWLLQS
jgi:hypothetical protein